MKKFLVLLMMMIMAMAFTACGGEKTDISISGDYQSDGRVEDNTVEPKPESTQKESGTIGDYEVSIVNSEIITSKRGKKAMLVTYTFKNGSDKTVKFTDVLSAEAYQNDTACAQARVEDYSDLKTMMADVAPGETKEVCEAYILQDDSDVTVQVSKEGQTSEEEQKDTEMITRVFKVQ